MNVQTDTDVEPTSEAPDCWPPLAHLVPPGIPLPVKPGTKALCGARLMGIDLRDAADCKVCERCLAVARRWIEGGSN